MSEALPVVRLKRGRYKSVLSRHPWIFSGSISSVHGSPVPGAVVDVHDQEGGFLARGYYNPHSQITVRILTWNESEPIDRDFWRRRLQASIARRGPLLESTETTAYRLAFAESDGLPGLIVDRYGEWVVLQSLTYGIEPWKTTLADLLVELTHARGVYERSDVDVRGQERLEPVTGDLAGERVAERVIVSENGLRFQVDIAGGHKTGFYLDQRDNRRKIAPYCADRRVLNVFSYTGAFAVYAARAGAAAVTNVDSSYDALVAGEENLRLNGLEREVDEHIQGDAFQVLRGLRDEGRRFDLVILDPPKFAYNKSQVTAATRGYKDINMLGMQLLEPGGILCTFSCSGLISEDLFQKVLFGASVDVGRDVRILERLAQGTDHPVLLTFPEAAYLKGFICQVE
ncbi:MAG: class I SAM-dependent rRNA methyltransferase [Chloroflexi bacterium]|nr:class I SAM-dependent rRNA methyltransferase [Chloroflexota bacterium]